MGTNSIFWNTNCSNRKSFYGILKNVEEYRNYSNLKRPLINAHRPFLAKMVIYFPLILLTCPKFLVIYFPLIINAQPNLR